MIELAHLRKYYRVYKRRQNVYGLLGQLFLRDATTVKAVDDISFTINAGESVGILGPNGAGKSTTIKMLCGLLVPTSGEVWVNGRVPWKRRRQHVASIGAVFGQRTTLWPDLPVIESLTVLKHIYKVPSERFQRNLKEFRELLALDAFLHTPVRSLSLGQRMRADICAALLHEPKVLFLDEPTIGLDVVAKERLRQFITRVNQERATTILLTTHDLIDIEKLCQRVLIIDKGHLLFDGNLADLRARFGQRREVRVDFADNDDHVEVAGADIVAQDGTQVVYRFNRDEMATSDMLGHLLSRYSVRDISVRESDIEEIVRHIYEHRLLD